MEEEVRPVWMLYHLQRELPSQWIDMKPEYIVRRFAGPMQRNQFCVELNGIRVLARGVNEVVEERIRI